MKRLLPFLFLGLALVRLPAAPLEIRPGDHICLIGNTLAERMQFERHNHWETLLYQRFPKHNLVVRNLSWSADEVALRPRAEGFGTPDEHLTFSKADVVIAFFGFNESFQGPQGVEKFKADLTEWIKHTKEQDYSGKGAPRIALVSPIAAENLGDPNLPDGKAINERLVLYTAAMKEVAEEHGVAFADIYHPTRKLFTNEGADRDFKSYTFNGIHVTAKGDQAVAQLLEAALFGWKAEESVKQLGALNEQQLRTEIESKNQKWYNRYRIVDSYYVYGGRSGLKFADGDQTNRDVMQREREVLDVMTANRDARIWKLAQGETVPDKIDDSDVPPFLEVKTSFGVNQRKTDDGQRGQSSKNSEGGSALIPSVADTLKSLTTAKGFKVECFASEEQFPELANATSMAFDTKGRLWVCTMPSYPQWRPGDEFEDKIIILEDTDNDGKANTCKTFADNLHLPISFEFYKDGILVSSQRDLVWLRDTNSDDKADDREVVLSGFDSADSHHVINAFTKGPGGDLYFQEGTFHNTQVETPYGPVRCVNAGTYRYEPLSNKLSVFVSYNYANPHGIAFDQWGQTFIADASGGSNYFATAFSGYLPFPEKHSAMQTFLTKRVRPTSGCEFVSSRNFPDDMQGNFLLNNCIGVQGTLNHRVKAVGSGYEAKEIEPLVLSSDPNFRPVDMEFAPDGSLYLVDWAEALIGHMQYSIRDPLRDHKYGRIWRVWNTEKPLVKPAKIDGASVHELISLLKAPEFRTRERAKLELSKRSAEEILKSLDAKAYDDSDNVAKNEHFITEVLWLQQYLNLVNPAWLKEQLTAQTPEARAAGVRVLCYWRDRIPEALSLLKKAANDESPLVRLEAVRACSFFASMDGTLPAIAELVKSDRVAAAEAALEVLKHPMDYYLNYTLGETMRALKPAPQEIDIKSNPAALAYVLDKMTNDELKLAPREEAVLAAQIERKGLDSATKDSAATDLAKLRKTSREAELVAALIRLDDQQVQTPVYADLGKLLAGSDPKALKAAQDRVTRIATKDHGVRDARIAGMAAFVRMSGDPKPTWEGRKDNHETLSVLMESVALIPDPALRAKFQPLVEEGLTGNLPPIVMKPVIAAAALTGLDHATTNFKLLSKLLLAGQYRDLVARAIMQLPPSSWDKAQALPLADSILAFAKTVPANQRAKQAYVEVSQLGLELGKLVPGEAGAAIRKGLRDLGVSVFVIKTVREQMRYDTIDLTVEAGKPFEIIFENNDIMPHNLVFIDGPSHMDVGTKAMTMTATPDRRGYLYIPDMPVIWKKGFTHMLEPGQTERLQLRAPAEPGQHEYVCTFPGHFAIMWGKLNVVKDLETHLQQVDAAK